jgi:MoaA/NifB/PqqE/SkfB family radical SAM enzyme
LKHIISKIKGILLQKNVSQAFSGTISPKEIDRYNEKRARSVIKSFCLAPSTNMLFAQDGSVRVCCHNLDHVIGRYPNESLMEIWKGHKAKEIRMAMEAYDLSKGCAVCQGNVDLGAYEEVTALHFDSLAPINDTYPQMMEFLLSNVCNLECVMCQGEFSSLIRKNREKLPPLISPYDSEFIRQVKPFLKNLKEARFSGSGEAFAI